MNQKWNIQLKDSRIYDILKEMGISHQKAHCDYENADQQSQQDFTTIKKLEEPKPRHRLVFYDEFAVYDRLLCMGREQHSCRISNSHYESKLVKPLI